jgi:hypothetical protein
VRRTWIIGLTGLVVLLAAAGTLRSARAQIVDLQPGYDYLVRTNGSAAPQQFRLEADGELSGGWAWSPDGRVIAAINIHYPGHQAPPSARLVLLDGQAPDPDHPLLSLTLPAPGYKPAWSPDGAWIAYLTDSGVVVASADGSTLSQIVRDKSLAFTWTADSSAVRMLFARPSDTSTRLRLESVTASVPFGRPATTVWLPATSDAENPCVRQVAWSPDGEQVAYVVDGRDALAVPSLCPTRTDWGLWVWSAQDGAVHLSQNYVFADFAWVDGVHLLASTTGEEDNGALDGPTTTALYTPVGEEQVPPRIPGRAPGRRRQPTAWCWSTTNASIRGRPPCS